MHVPLLGCWVHIQVQVAVFSECDRDCGVLANIHSPFLHSRISVLFGMLISSAELSILKLGVILWHNSGQWDVSGIHWLIKKGQTMGSLSFVYLSFLSKSQECGVDGSNLSSYCVSKKMKPHPRNSRVGCWGNWGHWWLKLPSQFWIIFWASCYTR